MTKTKNNFQQKKFKYLLISTKCKYTLNSMLRIMKNTLYSTIIISVVASLLVNFLFFAVFTDKGISGTGGYVSVSKPSATITGYEWLQLNNKSDNKISLANGSIFITSPSLLWNGEIVATEKWVKEYCK